MSFILDRIVTPPRWRWTDPRALALSAVCLLIGAVPTLVDDSAYFEAVHLVLLVGLVLAGARMELVAGTVVAVLSEWLLAGLRVDEAIDAGVVHDGVMAVVWAGLGPLAVVVTYHLTEAPRVRERRAAAAAAHAIVVAMAVRDHETGQHSRSVSELAAAIGRRMGFAGERLELLETAALLHDIGKIAVPIGILQSPQPLSGDERTLIEKHTLDSQRIVESIDGLRALGPILRAAHERWDGAGYPDGIAGPDIPLESRIVFVCDSFEAMTADRPYSEPRDAEDALEEIERSAGTQFDPSVVPHLRAVLTRVRVPT